MTIDPSPPGGDLSERLATIVACAERLTSYGPTWRPVRNEDDSWCVHGPNGVCIASTGKDAYAEARARFIAALDPALVLHLATALDAHEKALATEENISTKLVSALVDARQREEIGEGTPLCWCATAPTQGGWGHDASCWQAQAAVTAYRVARGKNEGAR